MGSKLRRPSKPSVDLSTTSSKSSGISPKKNNKATAKMATETSSVAAGNDKDAEKKGGDSAGTNNIEKAAAAAPGLVFYSMQNGTLLSNARYQPHTYEGPKDMKVTPKPQTLSAKSADFVPAASGAKQTPTKKPGQPGVFGSSRHTHYDLPQRMALAGQSTSIGAARIQRLINDLPAYKAVAHIKHLSDSSNNSGDSSTSAMSGATSHTTLNALPYKVRENVLVRVNQQKKDFIVHTNGFTLNRLHVDEYKLQDGKLNWVPHGGYNPMNILAEIAGKTEAGKDHFWRNHHVQIDVDLRNFSSTQPIYESTISNKGKGKEVAHLPPPTVLDHMARLGNDFYKYASRITVNIVFPPPRTGAVAPFIRALHSRKGVIPDFSISVSTPGFALIESLVVELNKCASLHFLEVIVHNPTASTTLPFDVEQLYYCLPFYDMYFENWAVKWQATYMSEPIDVGHFPIMLLDKERNRWMWAKQKAKRDEEIKARHEQEKINNIVYVRKSAAPEHTFMKKDALPGLPEPLPKPQSTPAAPTPAQVEKKTPDKKSQDKQPQGKQPQGKKPQGKTRL